MPGFAYPCGSAPGFDPGHIAAGNTVFSAIALSGNALNLLNGTVGTLSGVPTQKIDGVIGPSLVSSTNAVGATFPIGVKNDTDFTAAAIVVFPLTGSNPVFLCQGTGTGNGLIVRIGTNLEARIVLAVSLDSGFAPSANVPYFYAVSASRDTGTWNHNHVVVNLATGQRFSSATTGTVGTAGTAATTNYKFGNVNGGGGSVVNVAAAMLSSQFNSLATLKAWADNPWNFWYPR
jgi:hypothetical protein